MKYLQHMILNFYFDLRCQMRVFTSLLYKSYSSQIRLKPKPFKILAVLRWSV